MKKVVPVLRWLLFAAFVPLLLYCVSADTWINSLERFGGIFEFVHEYFRILPYGFARLPAIGMTLLLLVTVLFAALRWRVPAILLSGLNLLGFVCPIILYVSGAFGGAVFRLDFSGSYAYEFGNLFYAAVCIAAHVAVLIICITDKKWVNITTAVVLALLGVALLLLTFLLSFTMYHSYEGIRFVERNIWYNFFGSGFFQKHFGIGIEHWLCFPPLTACEYFSNIHVNTMDVTYCNGAYLFPGSMGVMMLTMAAAVNAMRRTQVAGKKRYKVSGKGSVKVRSVEDAANNSTKSSNAEIQSTDFADQMLRDKEAMTVEDVLPEKDRIIAADCLVVSQEIEEIIEEPDADELTQTQLQETAVHTAGQEETDGANASPETISDVEEEDIYDATVCLKDAHNLTIDPFVKATREKKDTVVEDGPSETLTDTAESVTETPEDAQAVDNLTEADESVDGNTQTSADTADAVKTEPESTSYLSMREQIESLRMFKQLLDEGVITQEEFEQKKKQLMGL